MDKCRNAAAHTKRCLMGTIACPCERADLQWLPHVTGIDGRSHIIAKQGQIDWSKVVDDEDVAALCRSMSAKTRLQPSRKWMRGRIFAAVVKWIRQHKMAWSTWTQDDATKLFRGESVLRRLYKSNTNAHIKRLILRYTLNIGATQISVQQNTCCS